MKIDATDLIEVRQGNWIAITQMDHDKNEGRFKWYSSLEEAMDDRHKFSLSQFPEWHKESCSICRDNAQLKEK